MVFEAQQNLNGQHSQNSHKNKNEKRRFGLWPHLNAFFSFFLRKYLCSDSKHFIRRDFYVNLPQELVLKKVIHHVAGKDIDF